MVKNYLGLQRLAAVAEYEELCDRRVKERRVFSKARSVLEHLSIVDQR